MKEPLDLPRLFPALDQIQDADLRRSVTAVWQRLWSESAWDDVMTLPTSHDMPYPQIPHNRAIIDIALATADALQTHHGLEVDRDVLIAAAILQDASKLVELQPGENGPPEITEIGRLYPHPFWGAHVALEAGVPDAVTHIVFSHSPDSPRFPESLEGLILYYADQLDVLAIHTHRWQKRLIIMK